MEQEIRTGDRPATCANPFCATSVRVRGEFCRPCRVQQETTRQQLRKPLTADQRDGGARFEGVQNAGLDY